MCDEEITRIKPIIASQWDGKKKLEKTIGKTSTMNKTLHFTSIHSWKAHRDVALRNTCFFKL